MKKEKATKKKDFSDDIINLEIKKDKNIIKIDNDDDLNFDNNDTTCGIKDDFENMEIKKKKIIDRTICNKCKINKSCYYVRAEFVCK
jgi:hypothetical protein